MVANRPFLSGSPGCVRSSAWICDFSSTESTMAWAGGSTYSPTMARSFSAKRGSLESLKARTRCGCKPCARQIRCTELGLMPTAAAIAAAVQCVVSPGGSPVVVSATTRAATSAPSGGMRGGRVLSRSSPSTPAVMNRSCQRQTATLLVPARRMISTVPWPSAVSSTIRARQTCFCGLFRSATTASRRARSAASTATMIPLRMNQIYASEPRSARQIGLLRMILSTRALSR
jgi:hypothetical protein